MQPSTAKLINEISSTPMSAASIANKEARAPASVKNIPPFPDNIPPQKPGYAVDRHVCDHYCKPREVHSKCWPQQSHKCAGRTGIILSRALECTKCGTRFCFACWKLHVPGHNARVREDYKDERHWVNRYDEDTKAEKSRMSKARKDEAALNGIKEGEEEDKKKAGGEEEEEKKAGGEGEEAEKI